MTDKCAIFADYVNWRPITGRRVLALTFEVDISRQEEVLRYLGAPASDKSIPCAIALLDLKAKQAEAPPFTPVTSLQAEGGSPKKSWADYKPSQQCAILCRDPDFRRYLKARDETDAIITVKDMLRVDSRKLLDSDEVAAGHWAEMVALFHLHRERLK